MPKCNELQFFPEQNPSILDDTCPQLILHDRFFNNNNKTGSHLPQISRHQKKIHQDLGAGTGNIQASPSWKLREKNWQKSSILQRTGAQLLPIILGIFLKMCFFLRIGSEPHFLFFLDVE